MDFLRKLFGDKQQSQQQSQCNFADKVVPVTNNLDKFVRNARLENPIGLVVRIKDWALTYGELLHRGGSSTPNLFTISPSASCHLICAQCNVEFDEATLAQLGPDSVMSAFGVAPVNRCHACGSTNVIIVFAEGKQKGKDKQRSVKQVPDDKTLTPAAIKKLSQKGSDAVEPLIAALQDDDLSVQKAAVRALGRIADPRAIKPLLDIALSYRDKPLRAEADKALVAIGEPALPATIKKLEHKESHTRIQAADLLGKMGNPQAVAPLVAAMHKESEFSESGFVYRSDYIMALGQIGGEAAVKGLVEALRYTDNRQAATRWLAKFGADAVPPLIVVLGDAAIGDTATRILVKIGEPSVEPLITALEKPNSEVRIKAVKALRKLAQDPHLEQSLQDKARTAADQVKLPAKTSAKPKATQPEVTKALLYLSMTLDGGDEIVNQLAEYVLANMMTQFTGRLSRNDRKLEKGLKSGEIPIIVGHGVFDEAHLGTDAWERWLITQGTTLEQGIEVMGKKVYILSGNAQNPHDGRQLNWAAIFTFHA